MASHRKNKPLLHSTELSESVRMNGDMETDCSLLIKGSFSGSIKSSSHITIAKGATVESCTIDALSLSIFGRFSGAIRAGTFVELCDKASVSADVETYAMSIADTSRFEGQIRMPGIGD